MTLYVHPDLEANRPHIQRSARSVARRSSNAFPAHAFSNPCSLLMKEGSLEPCVTGTP